MTRRRYVPDWRTRLAMWLAWHMPREVVYWCAVRVVTHAGAAPDGALTAAQALEAWEEATP